MESQEIICSNNQYLSLLGLYRTLAVLLNIKALGAEGFAFYRTIY